MSDNNINREELYKKQLDIYYRTHDKFKFSPIYLHPNIKRNYRPSNDTHEIGLARARLVDLLKNAAGYDVVEPLKKMPALDTIEWAFFHPYTVDVYAEKHSPDSKYILLDRVVVDLTKFVSHLDEHAQCHKELSPVILPDYDLPVLTLNTFQSHKSGRGVADRSSYFRQTMTLAKKRHVEQHHLTSKKSNTLGEGADSFVLKRGMKKKKEMICRHYDIPEDRYIEINHMQLYSRPQSVHKPLNKSTQLLSDEQILELLGVESIQQVTT